jgi:hypothetical protein
LAVFFPLSVITSNCNRIKISFVCFGKGFRCHSLIISLSQTVLARNHTKKLANMPAKRKCKKGIAIQTDLNRPNENAVEDLWSVVHHEDTSEVEGHTSDIDYHIKPHIVNYNYDFRGKRISSYNIFCYISDAF